MAMGLISEPTHFSWQERVGLAYSLILMAKAGVCDSLLKVLGFTPCEAEGRLNTLLKIVLLIPTFWWVRAVFKVFEEGFYSALSRLKMFDFLTDECVSDNNERIRSIQIDKNFITQTFRIYNFIISRTVRKVYSCFVGTDMLQSYPTSICE